jgi:hypothetical protein
VTANNIQTGISTLQGITVCTSITWVSGCFGPETADSQDSQHVSKPDPAEPEKPSVGLLMSDTSQQRIGDS